MEIKLKYMPAFRARQQETLVLKSFDFGSQMYPLIEIIKEKDRSNNTKGFYEIHFDLINGIKADKVFVDLPAYFQNIPGMQDEVIAFNNTVLSNIDNRIEYYKTLGYNCKSMIPVISTLLLKTGQVNTIALQFNKLREKFSSLCVRTFTKTFEEDIEEIRNNLTDTDFLIYDIDDKVGLTNPKIKMDIKVLSTISAPFKIALRSAVNTDIQNIRLEHGEVVYQADNSLMEMYETKSWKFNAFGDYVGIKKDDLREGGGISPGLIFYNPVDNLYYGYKGKLRELSEFETTIIPALLSSKQVEEMHKSNAAYLNNDNKGWDTIQRINRGEESGKSQAKFKRIAMEHYLHSMKILLSQQSGN